MSCANLSLIETVTSTKLATKINASIKDSNSIGVFVQVSAGGISHDMISFVWLVIIHNVQVNTSGEDNKNGVSPDSVVDTVKHIVDKCPKLKFCGLMTIGDLGNSEAASKQVKVKYLDIFAIYQFNLRVLIRTLKLFKILEAKFVMPSK